MPDFYKYKYNGKELDLVHGLNTYDYRARQYNPVIPMWDRVDPLNEKYYNVCPYAYCYNNSILFYDEDGREGHSLGTSIKVEYRKYSKKGKRNYIEKVQAMKFNYIYKIRYI